SDVTRRFIEWRRHSLTVCVSDWNDQRDYMAAIDALRKVIEVEGWSRDEEFAVHPYGSKAKRTLICPLNPDHSLLIPGHSYLFKRAEDWKAQQMWSEAIA